MPCHVGVCLTPLLSQDSTVAGSKRPLAGTGGGSGSARKGSDRLTELNIYERINFVLFMIHCFQVGRRARCRCLSACGVRVDEEFVCTGGFLFPPHCSRGCLPCGSHSIGRAGTGFLSSVHSMLAGSPFSLSPFPPFLSSSCTSKGTYASLFCQAGINNTRGPFLDYPPPSPPLPLIPPEP